MSAQGVFSGVRAAVTWYVASALAWAATLAAEGVGQFGDAAAPVGEAGYLAHLALAYSLFGTIPVFVLHGLRLAVARLPRVGRHANLLTVLLVAGLAVQPALEQADFLTSGSDISTSTAAAPMRIGLFLLVVASYGGLWAWHLFGVASAPAAARPEGGGSRARQAVGWLAFWALGAAALFLLVYIVSFELKAYAFFAAFLVLPAWFIASTCGFVLLRRPLRDLRIALPVLLFLVVGARWLEQSDPREFARARTVYMRRGKVAAWTDLLVYPTDTQVTTFQLEDAPSVDCAKLARRHSTPEPLSLSPGQRRNVLLISIDALRSDALRWSAHGKRLMPNLRAFAHASIDYRRAVTTYPATVLAVGGAFTGFRASQILLAPTLPKNIFQLSEKRFNRYFAFLPRSKWFQSKAVEELLVAGAFAWRHHDANRQTTALIEELQKARRENRSLIAWVHYYEPHYKYVTHPGYDFGDTERQRYKSELAYVDAELGRLFTYLEQAKFYDDTLIIVFSDHGEAMGEQDYFGHHVYLNSWITDVPLIVRAPGMRPRVSRQIADVTDIAATVLHFLSIRQPEDSVGLSLLVPDAERRGRVSFAEAFPIRGKSLFRYAIKGVKDLKELRERIDRLQESAKNYHPKVSVVSAEHRLIVNRVTGLEEFYDRRADPREKNDLSLEQRPQQRALRQALRQWTRDQLELLYCRVPEAAQAQTTPAREF